MSELTQMLNHQAKMHSRQNASSLAILLGSAADKIDQQEAELKEKQLEIDETDLRCAELEAVNINLTIDTVCCFGAYLVDHHEDKFECGENQIMEISNDVSLSINKLKDDNEPPEEKFKPDELQDTYIDGVNYGKIPF